MRPTDASTDRRAFLRLGVGVGAGIAGLSLTGCELNNPFTTASTPAAQAVRNLSPDAAAAVRVVARIRAVQAQVEALGTQFPRLAGKVAGLRALHEAHLAALAPAVPHGVDTTSAAPAVTAGSPATALGRLKVAEHRLHDEVVAAAGAVQSGPFARLLGTTAAGISQQLVVLAR